VGGVVLTEPTLVPGGSPGELGALEATDGAALPYRFFAAEGLPRATVLHLHGIQSHGGWYVETAAELARRGYSVYLADRRGSGRSDELRGDFASAAQLIDDVGRLVEDAGRSGAPVVLAGGCWGARPAVGYAARSPETLAALVLVCPALKAIVDLPAARKLQVFAGRALRRRTRVPIPLTPEMFTANPPYLEFVRNDPLSLHDVTARFFFNQYFWDRRLLAERAVDVPLLLMQAGQDPVVDVAAVRGWYDRLASPRKDYVRYPDFGHILDFERERQRYWDDLVAWLDGVTEGAAAA
jgi:alpha-beta hydrolase superfamily lysophospholipase